MKENGYSDFPPQDALMRLRVVVFFLRPDFSNLLSGKDCRHITDHRAMPGNPIVFSLKSNLTISQLILRAGWNSPPAVFRNIPESPRALPSY